MASVSVVLRCAGCAATVDPSDASIRSPFQCPNAKRAPNIDHVLAWDPVGAGVTGWPTDNSINPFIRYRTLQNSYWLGRSLGGTDADHVALVERLDRAISAVDGTGFRVTPLVPSDAASEALDVDVWTKNDTHNVAGSHKARHLMGLLLHLELKRVSNRTPLAIASCGNAAFAAATLGRAAKRPVHVHIPPGANPVVVEMLRSRGALLTVCPRLDSDPPGDPCMHRFHEALSRGELPFCVQGSENGLTIDGGATIGHELADQLSMLGLPVDRIFVQVGGGALGSAAFQGLRDAVAFGVLDTIPKFHAVQSEGCAPLVLAWERVAMRALRSLNHESLFDEGNGAVALALSDPTARPAVEEALLYAATHRGQFMAPFEGTLQSVAGGIIDDETYDWMALLRATFATGGWPVTTSEEALVEANRLVCSGRDPADTDETGSASLAGAITARRSGDLMEGERIVTLITGIRRT